MKLLRRIFLFGVILFSIFMLPFTVSANESNSVKVEKISINDSFADDRILVVLDEEASHSLKEYTVSDFKEIGCIAVEDLTSTATYTLQNNLQNDLVDLENYKRVLCVYLDKNSKENVINVIDKINNRDDILYAGPDYEIKVSSTTPNDPYIYNQWAVDEIELPQAWDYTTGSSDVIVGVIDTGIDGSHPELSPRLVRDLCRDFSTGKEVVENDPHDVTGHGTHVAGIIGGIGNNGLGICGVNWNVGLVSLRIYDERNEGDLSNFCMAVNYAQSKKIPILNFSSSTSDDVQWYTIILDCIASYTGLLICSAGNDGINIDNSPTYPACYNADNIISVGAIDSTNDRSDFSNYGINNVDIYAPGENILSTFSSEICDNEMIFSDGTRLCQLGFENKKFLEQYISDNGVTWEYIIENFSVLFGHDPACYVSSIHYESGYHYMDGTSQAAPHVAGVAALLLSENPNLTSSQIKSAILNGADTISIATPSGSQIVKKLNAYSAILRVHCHSYDSWKYNDRISHIERCRCGAIGTKTEAHMIKPSDVSKPTARCLGCYALLDMSGNGDIGRLPGIFSLRNVVITENGSYILPNGIIVLVDEDLKLYLNGELHFYV